MDYQDGLGETLCDLSQARIAPYKNTWKIFQNAVFWCNLKLAQQRGLQFYQTRSNAVVLNGTLRAEFIEKAICMKTKDQLYQWEKRDSLTACCSTSQFAKWFTRSTCTRSKIIMGIATRCGELRGNRSNTADFRIPGFSISTVKLQDARRQNHVTKVIEMFEKHQHRSNSLKT